MSRELDFNKALTDMFKDISYTWRQNAIVLGGTSGSGGGYGAPPGGFIGQLPQTQVTGDTDELRVLSSGSADSLLWNMNRIRYWLTNQISTSAPSPTFAGQIWIDGSSGSTFKIRNEADSAWITFSGGGASVILDPNSPLDVGSSANVGSSGSASHGDHVHSGLHGIYTSPNAFAYGDIDLVAGSGVNISQSSGSFTFSTSGSFVPIVHDINGAYHNGFPLRTSNGGLGTTQQPTAGAIPIGKTDGTYAPNNIVAGSNITITNSSGSVTIASSGGGHIIEDEGNPMTQRANLNFVGTAVAATDDSANNATIVTIRYAFPLTDGNSNIIFSNGDVVMAFAT